MCYLVFMSSKHKMNSHSISSMTGFASVDGSMNGINWTWEAKSVNAKGLDLRCRVPQSYEKIEATARVVVGKAFKRGNFNLSLSIQEDIVENHYSINHTLLNQLIKIATDLQTKLINFKSPSLDGLLAARGVIEPIPKGKNNLDRLILDKKILKSLDIVLGSLAQSRIDEGNRIGKVLYNQLKRIKKLCKRADKTASLQPDNIRKKLKKQINELIEEKLSFSDERLAQEAAIYLIKADVREELDRLNAHVESAELLMMGGGAIGRKLDFLCQEFNREVNTLCSKSSDIMLSKIGLELKAVIEQYREQVQNIE